MLIKQRMQIGALVLSAATLVGIATRELYVEDAYIPIPGDVPTIGYGHTEGVKPGQKTTPDRALVVLLADADKTAKGVQKCVTVPVYQHEFSAYTSLAFNIGTGAFCESTLVKLANEGKYSEACAQILRWNRAGGRVVRGLTIRRQVEYAECMGKNA